MPCLRGVTVRVTDKEGNDLPEYGVQHLRLGVRGPKVSAYIQSKTDVQFQVSVQPRIPFIDADNPESESEAEAGPSSRRRRNSSHLRSRSEHNRKKHPSAKATLSSPIRQPEECSKHPKFSFLGALFLDGRSKPERKVIIYLDPADSDFNLPDGKVSFKHRWVQASDGSMTEHAWVFKEKAIETVFDRLMINSSQARSEGRDENNIIEAMRSSGFGIEEEFKMKQGGVGQIIVDIFRVILGEKSYDNHYRSKHQEGQDEDINMDDTKADVTHATGLSYRSTIAPSPLRVVDYSVYKPEEGPWATFQFFYRSAEKLQSFGFRDFQPAVRPAKTGRALNACMASLTPLSITHPTSQKPKKRKQDGDSYEEKVNKKTFKSENDLLKPNFGSDYRDASADDELEAEEVHKSPSTGLPFLIPKAPKVGPKREVNLPGLPPLDSKVVPTLASTSRATVTQLDIEKARKYVLKDTDILKSSFAATVNTSFYIASRDPRNRTTPRSGPSENTTSTSKGSIFLATAMNSTAEQDSSPALSRQNVAKLNTPSMKEYRPSSLAQRQTNDGEDEDADDERNTESDLETHPDEDEIKYDANPEEEDERHESLKTQFKNVGIRKRTHEELEDGEIDDEGAATLDGGTNGGHDTENKTLVLPLTEEEKEQVRRGKKARTKGTTDVTDEAGGKNASSREEPANDVDKEL